MFLLIRIPHSALNTLEYARPHLPEILQDAEGLLYKDHDGHVQAAIKVDVSNHKGPEEVQSVAKAMGASILLFASGIDDGNIILKGPNLSDMVGYWAKRPQGEKPKGEAFFMNGSIYQVRATL